MTGAERLAEVGAHVINHPREGRIGMDLFHLRLAEQPGLTVVLQTPASPADRATLQRLVDRSSRDDGPGSSRPRPSDLP
jgi:hypothetical protein